MSVHVLPFALWHDAQSLQTPAVPPLAKTLPGLSHWLARARADAPMRTGHDGQPSLSLPHEHVQARAHGWPVLDGLLPWAAQAACAAGLAVPGDASAWGFVSLCHWQVSHGLATLTDPDALALTAAEDQALFAAMRPFFEEDGLHLHPWQPGQWLVSSPALAQLPTASVARVIGEDVDAWLVGGETPDATARMWRRLQNEMQMLLYTHAVNADRRVPVNSFWLHGTGTLPATTAPAVIDHGSSDRLHAVRRAWLARDLAAWLTAWQDLDAHTDWTTVAQLVLCGAHQTRSYRAGTRSWWQSLWSHTPELARVLSEDAP